MASKVQSSTFLISNALAHSNILLHLAGKTRTEVLRELVCAFPTDQAGLRDQLFAAVQAREELCSTAIDGGVAIPHSRQAISRLVERPVIVFARHSTGIDFGAEDHQPTRLFFLLCADGIGPHLRMLSRLSRLLRSSGLREQLMQAATSEEVLVAIRNEEAHLG